MTATRMMTWFGWIGVLLWFSPTLAFSQGRNLVQLEIVSGDAGMVGSNQKWLEVLSEVGADSVRMRRAVGRARPDVEKTETETGASYRITGVIANRNQLILPGGKFTMSQADEIRAYIDSIRADGAEVALAEKMAFGLTAEQLVDVHTDLSPVFKSSTVGMRPAEVLDQIRQQTKTPLVLDPSAETVLRGEYVLSDEFQGLANGTVLAAALRPLGLVMAPHRQPGKETELVITDSHRVEEHWPIGWPLEKRPSQAIPKLYERIPVNIQNYTLKGTLEAIQQALDVPFLYDRNSMLKTGLDPEEVRINLESPKLSYLLILNRIMGKVRPRMQFEIRADEKGQPFIWLSAR